MQKPITSSTAELHWRVDGMDCGGCAKKIAAALERLGGVCDVNVSAVSGRLSLKLDEARTRREAVEALIAKLGYSAEALADTQGAEAAGETGESACGHGPDSPCRPKAAPRARDGVSAWHRTAKGRLVILAGTVLAVAWASKFIFGAEVSQWVFTGATLVALVPVARRAFAALAAGIPFTIEMLMTIAASGAILIGAVEEAAIVVFLFAVGEVLEGVAADRARAGIAALADLVPKTALLVDGNETRLVDAAELAIGQTVLVRPGDRIPADGEIVEGTSGIDESPVTGESVPVTKAAGDPVYAGSINTEAALHVRVARAPEDNTIARIIRLVEEAQEARAPTERFIDRFSRVYMPAIVSLAVLVAIVPPLAFGEAWTTWIYRALALLLIGCPCALVISVPASIASALSAGARHGLLMKGGAVIEAIAGTTRVAFDKTGTLTRGRPVVTDVEGLTVTDDALLALAASVEAGSSHPLAEAIVARAREKGLTIAPAREARLLAGRGVEAEVDGERVIVGSPRFAFELAALEGDVAERAAALEAEGKTVVMVILGGEVIGLIALRDEPREDAREAIAELGELGISAVMLTGDNARTARAIARDLGLEPQAELLPDDKLTAVRDMDLAGGVMMVGDGINDAPALAAATVGIAMGSGTDVALETADGALLRNRVRGVAHMIRLARAAMANIRENITIALGLKGVLLITSVLGLTGLWMAILADTGATVLVTLNALRLLTFGPPSRR